MFFRNSSSERVPGAKTIKRICNNCGNETVHVLVDQPYGLQVGMPFAKRPLLSTHKAYALSCPICGDTSCRLTKEQAKALQK